VKRLRPRQPCGRHRQYFDRGRPERGGIGADGLGRGAIILDERAVARPARQSLEPERTAPRVKVGDAQFFETAEAAGEHRE